MSWTSPQPFDVAATKAFPYACRHQAAQAVALLQPVVDDTYRQCSTEIELDGERLYIPHRFHFVSQDADLTSLPLIARAILTRATDGYLRQRALKTLLREEAAFVAPFVVLLAAEYVVEIAEDIRDALPSFSRSAYVAFVRENRALMRTLRARATSYWDYYYRGQYLEQRAYPGLVVLHAMETWAA